MLQGKNMREASNGYTSKLSVKHTMQHSTPSPFIGVETRNSALTTFHTVDVLHGFHTIPVRMFASTVNSAVTTRIYLAFA
jgi:hypothetical protein